RAHRPAPRRVGRAGVRESGGAAQAARGLPQGHPRAHRADAARGPPVRAPDRLRGARQLEGVRGQLSRGVPRPVRPPRAVHAVRLRRLRDRGARLVFGPGRSAHRRPQRVHRGRRRSAVLPGFPQPDAERGAGTTAAERRDPGRARSLQGDLPLLLRRRDVARGTAAHRGGRCLLGQGAAGRRRDLRARAARAHVARVRQRSLLGAVRGGRLPLPEAPEDRVPRLAQALMPELKRQLGLLDSTMINVGTIIASAIFIVPSAIALELHASVPSILVWVAGGGVSLLGALSVAELGAAMPEAGGIYVYLREAYGPVWGYLYGWTSGVVINRSEEHTSELQSPYDLVCRLLLEKKNNKVIMRLDVLHEPDRRAGESRGGAIRAGALQRALPDRDPRRVDSRLIPALDYNPHITIP